MSSETCKRRATRWVNGYAAAGALVAAIPVPFGTSAFLTAAETFMVYHIAKIYRSDDLAAVGTAIALEMTASPVLKGVAEALTFTGPLGMLVKPAIAGSFIKALGSAIIAYLEKKHPGREYIPDDEVESSQK